MDAKPLLQEPELASWAVAPLANTSLYRSMPNLYHKDRWTDVIHCYLS